MKVRSLAAAAVLAALSGCTPREPGATAAAGDRADGDAALPATSNAAAPAPDGIDPNLPREIALVVDMLKDQLPLRQGPATIVDMEANGAEIIHTIQVPQDLDAATFAHFQAQLPVRTCGDPSARWAVDRGGTTTYKIVDKDGETFTASVTGCPPAGAMGAAPPAEGM